MADEVDCANLGLPADFFTDDFFVEEKGNGNGGRPFFPSESPHDWVWSTPPSAEAAEEDYLAKLTWQMAHYFLLDDDDDAGTIFSTEPILYGLSKAPVREPFRLFPPVLAKKKDNSLRGAPGISWIREQPGKKAQFFASWQRYDRAAQSVWTPAALHHQPAPPSSKSRPNGGGAQRVSGTGVFLPRQLTRPAEPKRCPDLSLGKGSAMPPLESKRGASSPSKTGNERLLPADWTY